MKASLLRNLQIGFGISFLLLITSSIASYFSIQNLIESSRLVDHTNEVILKIENVVSNLTDAETSQRGFLLSQGDSSFLKLYQSSYEQSLKSLNEAIALTKNNPEQQKNCHELLPLVKNRFNTLQQRVDLFAQGGNIKQLDFKKGQILMNQVRQLATKIIRNENDLLTTRTASMNKFASYTPTLIVIASLLSLLITTFSYMKVKSDFEQRLALHRQLEDANRQTANRIEVIQQLAGKISDGNYDTRLDDKEKDTLGNLAFSLNRMAASLQTSFKDLSDREWLQTGIAKLNEVITGEKNLEELCSGIIKLAVQYSGSCMGALYIASQHEDSLHLKGHYALYPGKVTEKITMGQGISGQCAFNGEEILISDIPENSIESNFSAGLLKPAAIIALPVFHNYRLKGVIELGSLKNYSTLEREFLSNLTRIIGISINSTQNLVRLQELLQETQTQSEELQAQHEEMEHLNAELEERAEKIQTSEEELKVTNEELQEKALLLEEKNELLENSGEELKRRSEELQKISKYKSEFLANMSHELRTPLNSILLLSKLLSDNTKQHLDGEEKEYAAVIHNSGRNLLELIDDILDLAKIEAGKMSVEVSPIELKSIQYNMESVFSPLAKQKGIFFKTNFSDQLPPTIDTDRLRVEQVLKNLLSNALKFTSKGGITFEAIPVKRKGTNMIAFSVSDTGIGIVPENHDLIFEAFQQADGSTRRKFGGTGLGLSISREIAQMLGGHIELESEVDKGSKFTFYLPCTISSGHSRQDVPQQKEPDAIIREKKQKHISAVIPEEIEDDRSNVAEGEKVILIVEDDTSFASLLRKYSNSKGYKAVICVRGDQAVDFAEKYRPAGILLDIELPVTDGWSVMDALKKNSRTKHIPVQIISSKKEGRELMNMGAIDFKSKPIELEQLSEVFATIEKIRLKKDKKVLVIKPNIEHAGSLAKFLEIEKLKSIKAESTEEALNIIDSGKADCLLVDLTGNRTEDYRTLETISRNKKYANFPIIAYTGRSLQQKDDSRLLPMKDILRLKTANSYKKVYEEIGLFLHLIENDRLKKISDEKVFTGKSILLVDDDMRNIFALTKILESHNLNVITATNGKEAIEALEKHPKLNGILMDIMMPEMDGYEAIDRIRKGYKFKNIPIIAVTAKAMPGDRKKIIDAGASDYIMKPVDTDQLISLLKVWLY